MPIKVLVVDDSPTMRALIKSTLQQDPGIRVVGEAGDPYEARDAIKKLSPDVLTLDVEMPNMNGLEFLEKIMRLRPMPVIMISTLTHKGGKIAVDALLMGAVDCIGKPTDGNYQVAFRDLPNRIRAVAHSTAVAKSSSGQSAAQSQAQQDFKPNKNMIAIGSSTGGVDALMSVIKDFPKNCPPTVITQHMPLGFTKSFAIRLNAACQPTVVEAKDQMPLKVGHVYLAPGGEHHLTVEGRSRKLCRVLPGTEVSGHIPSVDMLFDSVAQTGSDVVGIILTGMGRDGATGLGKIRKRGGRTIGQDERSCVVYGMPRIAFEEGAVEQQLPLRKIAAAALDLCRAP